MGSPKHVAKIEEGRRGKLHVACFCGVGIAFVDLPRRPTEQERATALETARARHREHVAAATGNKGGGDVTTNEGRVSFPVAASTGFGG